MKKGKAHGKKIAEILSTGVILLCIVGVVGFFAYFTNGFTGSFTSFYLHIDGENVMGEKSGIYISPDAPLKADVRYTFRFASKDISGYSVKISPVCDFDFTVDGETYSFVSTEELDKGFRIEYEDDSFTLTPKGNMKDILQAVYIGSVIDLDMRKIPDEDYFRVTVYSKDESTYVTLLCRLTGDETQNVALTKEEIVF